jgi:L-arabinose isomerase
MLRVGLFAIGLDTYWPQFAGLRDRLGACTAAIAARVAAPGPARPQGITLVDGGMVDSPQAALTCAERFRAAGVDLVLIHVATYALSSTVLPVVQRLGVPVVVLGLQPEAAMDCAAINALGDRGLMTGAWLAHCQACSLPELASVFRRAGVPYRVVAGWLDDPVAWAAIDRWLTAAAVRAGLRDCRLGVLGRPYDGMLDVYGDLTQVSATFGTATAILELDELADLRARLDGAAVAAMRERLATTFVVDPSCPDGELDRAARTAAALRQLVDRHALGALAYYGESVDGHPNREVITSIIPGNTLLTADGIPVAGEFEVKNALAMKVLDLAGCGGSFSEFYGVDFRDDVVLLGHDGPGHAGIAEDRVRLVPLPIYHGKPGRGLSIGMRVRHGPVTMLSVVQGGDGQLSLLVAEGEAVPGPILDIGNTNSRYRFAIGARAFTERWSAAGPAHHLAIGTGHQSGWIACLADLLGIACQRVC